MLQYDAKCYSLVQCGAVCCSVSQCVAVYRSVLQCVAVCLLPQLGAVAPGFHNEGILEKKTSDLVVFMIYYK